ncbi:hypothetical protein ABPG72_002594 [Tetrahymena utriculariae]
MSQENLDNNDICFSNLSQVNTLSKYTIQKNQCNILKNVTLIKPQLPPKEPINGNAHLNNAKLHVIKDKKGSSKNQANLKAHTTYEGKSTKYTLSQKSLISRNNNNKICRRSVQVEINKPLEDTRGYSRNNNEVENEEEEEEQYEQDQEQSKSEAGSRGKDEEYKQQTINNFLQGRESSKKTKIPKSQQSTITVLKNRIVALAIPFRTTKPASIYLSCYNIIVQVLISDQSPDAKQSTSSMQTASLKM